MTDGSNQNSKGLQLTLTKRKESMWTCLLKGHEEITGKAREELEVEDIERVSDLGKLDPDSRRFVEEMMHKTR